MERFTGAWKNMGFRHRFEFGLAWRTLVLILAIWLFVEALSMPGLRAARLVAAILAFAALASLWQFIRRTNFQMARKEARRFPAYVPPSLKPRKISLRLCVALLQGFSVRVLNLSDLLPP